MSVSSSTEVELERLGLTDTVEGQAALVLARNLDSGRNGMAKQGDTARLLEVMQGLRRRVVREADTVDSVRDQLAEKRRRAAAAG
jgi:hypothetical protein